MIRKTIRLSLFALVIVALGATSAMALCSPPKTFHSWQTSPDQYYGYVYNFGGNIGSTVGAFWQPGGRLDSNEGNFGVENWLRYYGATSQWYLVGNMGTAGVNGCPQGEVVVAFSEDQGGTASFAVAQADETPTWNFHFLLANVFMAEIPRPQITNRSRIGDVVTLDMQVADVSSGFSSRFGRAADGYISGINLYSFTGTTDPGREAGAWTLLRTVPFAGGSTAAVGVDIDCSDHGNDVFLAAGIEVTGEYSTVHLGASTIVECDPTLADPSDRFDLIRERGKGHKKGRPFTR